MPASRVAGRAGRGARGTFGRAPRAAEITPSRASKRRGRAEGFCPSARPPLFVLTHPRGASPFYLLPPRALGRLVAPWVLVRSFFFRFNSHSGVESAVGDADVAFNGGGAAPSNASMLM